MDIQVRPPMVVVAGQTTTLAPILGHEGVVPPLGVVGDLEPVVRGADLPGDDAGAEALRIPVLRADIDDPALVLGIFPNKWAVFLKRPAVLPNGPGFW